MDKVEALRDWLVRIGGSEWSWFAKRLSANDTGQTGAHQVGFYVPREFALTVAPELGERRLNPRRQLAFFLLSHEQHSTPAVIYYNSKIARKQANGRNEFRVTGFGGRSSALQDPTRTDAILVSAWHVEGSRVEAWIADSLEEEEAIEAVVGPIEPATVVTRLRGQLTFALTISAICEPSLAELPQEWATTFPPGEALTREAVRRRPAVERSED
jgi:hypothetical protein